MDFSADDAGPATPGWLAQLPAFSFNQAKPEQPNLFTSALSSGFHEALGNFGGAAQAVGTALGVQPVTDWGRGFAKSQEQQAVAAGRPDLEADPWSLKGIAYNLTKSLPTIGGAIASDVVGGPVGAGLFMLPQAVGGNVQAAEEASGQPLTPGDAAKSLLLGGPEAAAMAFLPGKLHKSLVEGAAGDFIPRVLGASAKLGTYQGLLGGLQTAVTQEAFTPDMPIAQRARAVVDAALSGGLQGAVFGGVTSLRRAQAAAVEGDPATVSIPAMTTAIDAVTNPQALIPPPEHMSPLPKAAGDYSDTNNDDLLKMAGPLAEKGDARTSGENIEHGLIQGEIAKRTPPGLAPGEGTLFTPEQMAERAPTVEAMKQSALQVAGDGANSPFFQAFNASNDPEMVLQLSRASDNYGKKAPAWFDKLAEKYGVSGETPAEMLVRLQDEQTKSMELRDAALKSQKVPAIRAANAAVVDLTPKIAAAEKLLQTHLDADKLMDQQLPLPDSVADSSGQLNIPGMGEAESGVPTPEGQAPAEGLGVPTSDGQLRLLTPGEMGIPDARLAEMSKFQDLVMSKMPARVRARVEPLVRGLDVTNEPELIAALKGAHADLDGAPPPAPLADLLSQFKVADRDGTPIDLQATRQQLLNEYQDKLAKASVEDKAGRAGQANIKFEQAQDYRNTTIRDLDNLIQSHDLSADVGKPSLDMAVPDRVPARLADRWKIMEFMRTDSEIPAVQKAADTAQRAIEQNNPSAVAITQLALNRFTNEMRARVTTERPAAGEKPAPESFPQETAPASEPTEQTAKVTEAAKQLGTNTQPVDDAVLDNTSRAGGDAFRAGSTLEENPHPQGSERAAAWQRGWETAQRPTHVEPQAKRAPLPKILDPATSRAKIEAAVAGGKLAPEKLAQAQRALASRDPRAVQDLARSWSTIEQATGRPFNASDDLTDRKPTDWAEDLARDANGRVVTANSEVGLIQASDDLGNAIFLPVNRELSVRDNTDIRHSTVPWLHGAEKRRLIGIANREDAADKARFRANPEGPFKGAESNVIGTKNTDPKVVHYIARLVHVLGIDARVLVTHPDDVYGEAGNKLGLNGDFQAARTSGSTNFYGEMQTFGPGLKDFYIHVRPDLSDTLKIETAAHEVGHVVYETLLRNADKPTRDAIDAAYDAWYMRKSGAKAQDLIRATRNRATAKILAGSIKPGDDLSQQRREYFLSKGEWFADQVSRWATTAEKPVSLLDKFFRSVAQKMRELLTSITGKSFLPDAAVKEFLDRVGPGSDKQWMTSPVRGSHIPMTNDRGPQSVSDMDRTVHASISNLGDLQQKITDTVESTRAGLPTWMRRQALIAQTMDGIVKIGGDLLKSSKGWADTHLSRQVYTDAKNKVDVLSAAPYRALGPKEREMVDRHLAMLNDGSGLDSRKSWAAHTDLLTKPNAQDLAARHREMTSDLSKLQQAGARQAMEAILQMMQTKRYQALSAMLHDTGQYWAKKGVQFAGHVVNPDEVYRGMTGELGHDSPDATNLYYKNTVRTLRDGIQQHIDTATADAAAKGLKAPGDLNALKAQIMMIDQSMVQADRGTYVPLSRGDGSYFVSGKIALGDDKLPNAASVKALQAALKAKGFDNIGIFHDTASNTIMSRVEDMSKMERLRGVFSELEKTGHMLPGETKAGYPERMDTMAGLGPQYMHQMMEAANSILEHVDVAPEVADEMRKQFVARWMDMLPDHSVLQNLQQREHVSGFSKDLGATAIQSALNQSRASTSVGMRSQFAAASEAMRQEVQDAKSGPNAVATHDVAKELWLRESQQAWRIPSTGFDVMQSLMHTLRIGFSPPYILTMMSQIPTLSLPELSKKFGYSRSALAIAKAAPRSFSILRAVMSSPDWATVGFRETTLRAAGISEKDIATVMKLDNAGHLSNSTYTSAMADLGEGAGANSVRYKNMANAMGLYAEMFPRLVTALAAGDLHDARPVAKMSREQVVSDMVNGSQFNWGVGQSSRLTGKTGPLGAASRVVFQFTSFQTKLIEKLYTEVHAVLGKDGSQAQKEAGMFLAGHMVAMTALAGTLGLPIVGALAGLVDKLAGTLTGKDDIDVQGMYRTWLAGAFGPGVADVLAKGLPRGMGIDLSHLGEQNILPFTGILTDKRKFEDASRDWFKSMAGSAFGEASNMYLGGRDMLNGDYLRGAIKVLPEGFKGLAEGFFFYKNGYIDKNGTKYPLQPGAMDVLVAALGLDPANLAQYDEANRIRAGLMAERQYRSQNIETHLMRGLQNPDNANVNYWMNEAQQYAMDHPGLGNPLQRIGSNFMRATTRSSLASTLRSPLGVSPFDTGMQSRTGFLSPQE